MKLSSKNFLRKFLSSQGILVQSFYMVNLELEKRHLLNISSIIFKKKAKTKITEIPSPTFNIVYEYKIKNLRIQHFDLYRLKNKKECLNIGLFEEDNVVSIIEWPEKVYSKPKKRIEIFFKYFDNYNSRVLKIKFFRKK